MSVVDFVSLTRRKAILLFVIIFILCVFTLKLAQSGWVVTESRTIEGITEPVPVMHKEYLGTQNIASLGLLLLAVLYAVISIVVSAIKNKERRRLLTIMTSSPG